MKFPDLALEVLTQSGLQPDDLSYRIIAAMPPIIFPEETGVEWLSLITEIIQTDPDTKQPDPDTKQTASNTKQKNDTDI